MSAVEFCEICGVRMDMHDLTDSDPCESAEAQADRIERLDRMFFGFIR